MATRTLAPLTSVLPEDCTWNTARWSTRWNPSVGWVSRSSSSRGIRGVVWLMNARISLRICSTSAPQELSASWAELLSSRANNRCSTVMNSWRSSRASLNASFSVFSRSLFNIGTSPQYSYNVVSHSPSSHQIQAFSIVHSSGCSWLRE